MLFASCAMSLPSHCLQGRYKSPIPTSPVSMGYSSLFRTSLSVCSRRLHGQYLAAAAQVQPCGQPSTSGRSHVLESYPSRRLLQHQAGFHSFRCFSAAPESGAGAPLSSDESPAEDDNIVFEESSGAVQMDSMFQQLNLKLPQYCCGCGVKLQQIDPDGPGYFIVPAKLMETSQV